MNKRRARSQIRNFSYQNLVPKANWVAVVSIIGGLVGVLWIIAQYCDLPLGHKPQLTLSLIQNGKELGISNTRAFLPQKAITTKPLTVTVDEADGPRIVGASIELLLIAIQEAVLNRAGDLNVKVSPLHRDQVIRSIIERKKFLFSQSAKWGPIIEYKLLIGNGRSRTTLFRGESIVEYTSESGVRNSCIDTFPIENTAVIDEGKSSNIVIPLAIPVDTVVNSFDLAAKCWHTLITESIVAKTNFIPFLDYIGKSSDENIAAVLLKAPPFARENVFTPYVIDFKKTMYSRLTNANMVLTVKLWDTHNNEYIFESPLSIEIMPAGYSDDEWLKVASNSIRACRDMHQRVLDLGFPWSYFLNVLQNVAERDISDSKH